MNSHLDYLRIFDCVAQCGSMTEAARQLLTAQPNITRAINLLEEQLACRLFVRGHHGVTLTPEGEVLLAHTRAAFEHIETAERELALRGTLQAGAVSIGATEVALRCFLLPILKRFRERYPAIQIRVQNHSTPQAVSALCSGMSDLAIVTTPVDLPPDCSSVTLMHIRETAVCGAVFSSLTEREITLDALSRLPLVCLGHSTNTFSLYRAWFSRYNLSLSPSVEAATADQILPLVRSGLGIGFVPEPFLQEESEQTGIYPLHLAEPLPERSILLLRRSHHVPSLAASALEQMILESEKPCFQPPD